MNQWETGGFAFWPFVDAKAPESLPLDRYAGDLSPVLRKLGALLPPQQGGVALVLRGIKFGTVLLIFGLECLQHSLSVGVESNMNRSFASSCHNW